jgi:hypothetical protein
MKVCRRRQRDYFTAQQLRAFAAAVVYPLKLTFEEFAGERTVAMTFD